MTRYLKSVCLSITLLAATQVSAQEVAGIEPIESEEGVYSETVQVNVVNVEVFVTDKKGNPIKGLTRDDFEILEDRKPVAITNFFAVEDGKPSTPLATRAGEGAPSPAPQPTPSDLQRPPLPEEQRLHLIIYVDNFNIRPFNRNRVFRRLRQFLAEKLDSDDRVMLVSYDRSLHVRHQFTTDPQLVASALFELETMTGYGVQADSERRDLLREIDQAEELRQVEWRVRQYAESMYNDLRFSIDALKEMIESLGGLPGRKALLYVSDGLPMQAGEDLYHALSQKFQTSEVLARAHDQNASRRFQQLGSQANTNGVTFYAIDAAGLRVSTAASAEISGMETPGMYSLVDSVHFSNIRQPLLLLADLTGGQVIYNTNDVGPGLEKIASDFDTYYSLCYTSAHSGTGRYYRIEVKVNRKGLRVRHRVGYRDKPLVARMRDSTRATLMYGLEQNPFEVQVHFGESTPMDKGQFEVEVAVLLPLDKVVLVPREEYHEARVKLFFGAIDEQGDLSPVQELSLPIRIPNDKVEVALQGAGWLFREQLRMRSGGHRVAVGIWDEVGAAGSFVTRSIRVGG